MKIMIICSKRFYPQVRSFENILSGCGHEVILPNGFEDPETEERVAHDEGMYSHSIWKESMFRQSIEEIEKIDAVFVLNLDVVSDSGQVEKASYVGGSTLLEMYEAWKMDKKIFLFNDPYPPFEDEINGFSPVSLGGDADNLWNLDLLWHAYQKERSRYE